jgi:hypothetical protein
MRTALMPPGGMQMGMGGMSADTMQQRMEAMEKRMDMMQMMMQGNRGETPATPAR